MKINLAQRKILAIVVPICVLLIALFFASAVGDPIHRAGGGWKNDPFDWPQTGIIWFLSVLGIGIFEFIIFRDRSKE